MPISVPTDIAGCVLWLDAQDATSFTYSSGVQVSQWADKSGGGRHVVQATTGKQPARDGTHNGHDVVVFTKANADVMNWVGSNAVTGTTMTVVMLLYPVGTPASSDRMFTGNKTGESDWSSVASAVIIGRDNAGGFPGCYRDGLKSNAPTLLADQWLTVTSLFDGTNHTMYTGTTAYTPVGSTGTFDIDQFNLGGNQGGTETSNIRVAEVIVYNVALDSTQRSDVWTYLNTRWAAPPPPPSVIPLERYPHVGARATRERATKLTRSATVAYGVFAMVLASEPSTDLVIANSTHAHSADSVTLTQVHSLSIADGPHAHAATTVALTQVHQLVVADAVHAHGADNVTISTSHLLTIADTDHAHAADALTLTQVHTLTITDGTHGHSADAPALTQAHTLAVDNGLHTQTADNVTLTQVHALTISNAVHGQTADNVTLASADTLTVANASHGHTADNVTLTQQHQLVIASAVHEHTVEHITLTQVHVLEIDGTAHNHTADGPLTLTQVHQLVIDSTSHTHNAENVTLLDEIPAVPVGSIVSTLTATNGTSLITTPSRAGTVTTIIGRATTITTRTTEQSVMTVTAEHSIGA